MTNTIISKYIKKKSNNSIFKALNTQVLIESYYFRPSESVG